MRPLTRVLIVIAPLFLSGCAAMTVSAHVERGIDFTAYRSYDWGPPDNLPVGDPRTR